MQGSTKVFFALLITGYLWATYYVCTHPWREYAVGMVAIGSVVIKVFWLVVTACLVYVLGCFVMFLIREKIIPFLDREL